MSLRLRFIVLLLVLTAALGAAGQGYVIDSLCVVTQRDYRIEGETGSTYQWLLTDASGTELTLANPAGTPFTDTDPVSGLPVEGSEITILWDTPGEYNLTAIQYSIHGCDSTQVGKIKVFEQPQVFAGNPISVCEDFTATLAEATALHCSEIEWTTAGDGTFDDPTALNPVYTPGTADKTAGSVILTLRGTGLGNSNSCVTATSTVVITITKLLVTVSGTDAKCFGEASGTTLAEPTGGTPPYTYLWDDPAAQTTDRAIGLYAGTYHVTVTDAKGCQASAPITIGEPAAPVTAITSKTDVKCFNGNDGTALAVASGGTPPYFYLWNDPLAQNTNQATNLYAGTYEVTVTDSHGCVATATVIINQPPVDLTISMDKTDVRCFGASTGVASANVANGVPPYTYLWDDPAAQTDETATGLKAGTYHVTATDANGCTAEGTVVINEPPQLLATLGKTDVLCYGGSDGTAIALVSGGVATYSYLWDDPAAQTTPKAVNLKAGTYQVVITDANNCTITGSVTVEQPAAPLAATASGTDVSCYGGNDGTTTATVSGGTPPYSYLWDDPNAQTTATATNLYAGTYTVKVTDANGCETTATQTIVQPALPLTATASETDVKCYRGHDGTATANATGGTPPYAYLWDDPDAQTTATATELYAGVYTATVTDAHGCITTVSVTVNEPPVDLTVTAVKTDVNCFGGSDGTATATPKDGVAPYSYLWDDPAGQITATAANLIAGVYNVIVTDANGCTATTSVTISEPPQLVMSLTKTDVLCFGQNNGTAMALTSGGTPPYTYLWNDPASQQTPKASNLYAGTYHVVITDAHLCTVEGDVVVDEPALLTISLNGTDVNCYGGKDGTATALPTGGTPPYAYQWNDPASQTNPIAANLTAGIYQVTVTDVNGCSAKATITIHQPVAPLAATTTKTDIACYGGKTGTATVAATGGTAPYTYLWNDPDAQTTATAVDLFAGTYLVTVTDANNCTMTATVKISEPPADLKATATYKSVTCFGGSDGTATVIASNGTPPYSYLWDDVAAQKTATATNLTARTYHVIVTDANGCTTPASVTVPEPTELVLTETHVKESCNHASNGSINLTVAGGFSPYTYLWSNGATTQDVSGLAAGNYSVVVTDANRCTKTLNITIEEEILILTETHLDAGCDGAAVGEIDLTVSGGTAPYTFLWSNGATTEDLTALPAGNYSVIVTDAKGCENSLSVMIFDPWPFVIAETHEDIGCTGASSGSITLDVSGGTPPYIFLWSNGATSKDLSGLDAGEYSVIATDSYGCSIYDTITINESVPIDIADVHQDILCAGSSTGNIVITVSGGKSPYTYRWSNGEIQKDITGLAAGAYTVTVTDANNCAVSKTITLTEPKPITITETHTDVGYSDQAIGSIDITVDGGYGNYTYLWDNGATTEDITKLTGGFYTVTVTDENNCTQSLTIEITQIDLMTIAAVGTDSPCTGADGMIQFTFTNVPDGIYEILYDGGSFTGVAVTGNKAAVQAPVGNYKNLRLAVNGNNTVNSVNITIRQTPPMSIAATAVGSECSNINGTIEFTFRNVPDGRYDITYDGGRFTGVQVSRNFAMVSASAGTYNNLTLEYLGCSTNSVSVVLNQPKSLVPEATAAQPNCDSPFGKITVTYPKFGKGYVYRIDEGIYQTSPNFTNLAPGRVYRVQAKELSTNCESEPLPVTIYNVPAPPDAPLATILTQPTCTLPTGTLIVTYPTGNQYEYRIDTGDYQRSVNFSGIAPGDHQLIVRDRTTGCETTSTITIDQVPDPHPAPVASVTVQPDCYVTSGTIVVTDPLPGTGFEYSVDGDNYQASNIFSGLIPGNYSVQVRSRLSLCESDILVLTVLSPIAPETPVASVTNPDCNVNTGSVEIKSPLGASYQYVMDGGLTQTSPVFSNLEAGSTHSFWVIDTTTGCKSDPIDATIGPVPEPLAPPVKIDDPVACVLVPVQTLDARDFVKAVPGITVIWYDAPTGGNVVTTPTLNSVNSVTYYAESFDGICRSEVRTPVTLTLNPVPGPIASNGDISECEQFPIQTLNANAAISVPAGITPIWYDSPTGGKLVTPTLNTVNTVTYYVEAWNGYCPSDTRTPVTLTIVPMPAAPVSKGDLSVCETIPVPTLDARDAIDATGKNIIWYDRATGGNEVTTPTLNKTGSVTYYAVDFNGVCASAPRTPVKLTIYELPEKPVVQLNQTPGCTDPTGTAEVIRPVGPEYSYSIDNLAYQASPVFDKLTIGSHFIRVKNNTTGCESDTTRLTVPDLPPLPHITNVTAENCICYGDSGAINFDFQNVPDGTYVIIYLNGQFDNVQVKDNKAKVIAPAGNYNILRIEANGCTSNENWNIAITQPDQLTVSGRITEIDLKTNQKGEIDVTITGGTGKYRTIWLPNPENGFEGASTEDIKNLNAGLYTLSITDEHGCTIMYTDTIPKPNLPPIATDDEFDAKCSAISGDLVYGDTGNGPDSDPDNDQITIDTNPVALPQHGVLTINPDGTFNYQAFPGYTGIDSFKYRIFDVKKNYSTPATVVIHVVADFDCDGIPDDVDPDADGDGIVNTDEGGLNTDSDGDGHPNWLDIDADNDGIVDNIEGQSTPDYIAPLPTDTDHDGINDAYDPDNGGTVVHPVDTDGDGIPDFLDADSDDDGVPDYIEGHDLDANGKIDPGHFITGRDLDADGLDDAWDTVNRYEKPIENITGSNAPIQEFFGEQNPDGILDWRDENDDNDQYLTRFEDLNNDGDWSNDDTDHDGYPEYLDYGRDCDLFIPNAFSPNGDNIHDYFQIFCLENFPDAKIYIFDQLGNLLYEKENYGNLEKWKTPDQAWWDGRTRNRAASVTSGGKVVPGTYFYVLKLGNGEVRKSFVFISY